jgi:hypothetical protein
LQCLIAGVVTFPFVRLSRKDPLFKIRVWHCPIPVGATQRVPRYCGR